MIWKYLVKKNGKLKLKVSKRFLEKLHRCSKHWQPLFCSFLSIESNVALTSFIWFPFSIYSTLLNTTSIVGHMAYQDHNFSPMPRGVSQCKMSQIFFEVAFESKLCTPSTLNIDLILWHTQLIAWCVCNKMLNHAISFTFQFHIWMLE